MATNSSPQHIPTSSHNINSTISSAYVTGRSSLTPLYNEQNMLFRNDHCPPPPVSPTANPLLSLVLEGVGTPPDLYKRCNAILKDRAYSPRNGNPEDPENDDNALKDHCMKDIPGIIFFTPDRSGALDPKEIRSRSNGTLNTLKHRGEEAATSEKETMSTSPLYETQNLQAECTIAPIDNDFSRLAARVTPVPITECQWTDLDYNIVESCEDDGHGCNDNDKLCTGVDSAMKPCRYDHLFIPILQELSDDDSRCSSDMSISVGDEGSSSDMSMSSDDESCCNSVYASSLSIRSNDSFPSITQCQNKYPAKTPDVIRIHIEKENLSTFSTLTDDSIPDISDEDELVLTADRSKYFKPISLIENDCLYRMEFLLEQADEDKIAIIVEEA